MGISIRMVAATTVFLFALGPGGCGSSEDDCGDDCGGNGGCANCGSLEADCLDVCDQAQPCGALQTDACPTQCGRILEVTAAASCVDELAAYLACAKDAPDICEAGASCGAVVTAYLECTVPYCDAHAADEACKNFTCTTGSSGTGQTCSVSAQCTSSPEYELDCVDSVCTCTQDGVDGADVPFQEAFCGEDYDAAVGAAQAACNWTF